MAKTTIPTKNNISQEKGSLLLKVSDFIVKENMHLITLGNVEVQMNKKPEKDLLEVIGGGTTSLIKVNNKPLSILINWVENSVWLNVFTQEDFPEYLGATEPIQVDNIFNSYISLFEKVFFNGTYESITSYGDTLNQEDIGAFSLEVFQETTEVLFVADFSKPTHYQKNVVVEDTFAPVDGSPILLSDDKGPLCRQYFFNENTAEYQNEIVETFTYLGEKKRLLAYKEIEPSYKIKVEFLAPVREVFFTGEKVSLNGQYLILELTTQEQELLYGYDYKVTYQLERSYNIEFNEDVPHDGFRVNLVNMKADKQVGGHYSSTENVKMVREGNRFEEEYLAKEIELNPLINPQVQGFMYIDKDPQETNAFRISVSSQYLIGNGIDTASVMIEAIDSEGNEVLSPYLSVYLMDSQGKTSSGFGTIEPIVGYNSMKARNTSGRAYYELTAPIVTDDKIETHKVFVVAHDRKTGISAQYPIYVRSTSKDKVVDVKPKEKSLLEVPFEYFARYYNKRLKADSPLRVFDRNRNGTLDRSDMENIKTTIEEKGISLVALTNELINQEKSNAN